ncbi:MAG: D-serine ammonia-lyase [Pisciglobus halotolerans]|nr:D-serine ammonia-lyase [Pisciglobus halotolerans]
MVNHRIAGKSIEEWIESKPVLDNIIHTKEVFWNNPEKKPFTEAAKKTSLTKEDIKDAKDRLQRFASFIELVFPETERTNGLIESGISPIPEIKKHLEGLYETTIQGSYYLKRDDTLPIVGTIKARGAIYEVLKHAETLALENGLLKSKQEDYAVFASQSFKDFFSHYKITVGTTGNLGISVGTMGSMLGFEVIVHMSVEAKKWKKEFLKSRGVTVIEHKTNFTKAVEEGRKESDQDPFSYFVDDEHSVDLFLGYTTAGDRLKQQLDNEGVFVDADHPLFVYLPCGIGGSPGGVSFGLKQIYGDNVHCFFAEPTHMPSMLIGLITNQHDSVSVSDFNIDGKTAADGLAVPRTSGFVSKIMRNFFSGGYSVQDEEIYRLLTDLTDKENIFLEPAAIAGLPGAARLFSTPEGKEYIATHHLEDKMSQATHIAWATGGSLVPLSDREEFLISSKQETTS